MRKCVACTEHLLVHLISEGLLISGCTWVSVHTRPSYIIPILRVHLQVFSWEVLVICISIFHSKFLLMGPECYLFTMTPHRSTPSRFSVQANQKPDGLLKVFPGGFPFSDISRCHPYVGPQLCSSITDHGVSWAIQAPVFASFVNWPSEPL